MNRTDRFRLPVLKQVLTTLRRQRTEDHASSHQFTTLGAGKHLFRPYFQTLDSCAYSWSRKTIRSTSRSRLGCESACESSITGCMGDESESEGVGHVGGVM